MTPADHADHLVTFYRALTDGGVDPNVAGVLTIDLNKTMLAAGPPTPAAGRDVLVDAAERRRARRASELAGLK